MHLSAMMTHSGSFQRKLESWKVLFDSWHFTVRNPVHNKFETVFWLVNKKMDFSGQISDFIKKMASPHRRSTTENGYSSGRLPQQ